MGKKKSAVDEALEAAADAFKRTAQSEIDGIARKMRDVLTVKYKDIPKVAIPIGIPAPRLQLRWAEDHRYDYPFTCYYELVIPLREHDCRNDAKQNFGVIELSRTSVGGMNKPWEVGDGAPFRDGAHIQWDNQAFGGSLPMYVLSPDGAATPIAVRPEKSVA